MVIRLEEQPGGHLLGLVWSNQLVDELQSEVEGRSGPTASDQGTVNLYFGLYRIVLKIYINSYIRRRSLGPG